MIDTFLVPEKTTVNAKGDGPSFEVTGGGTRVFLLTLEITNIVEQESLDVSVHASLDGATWEPKPLVSFPQKFYRGETPLLLNLADHSEVKFVRAHWEAARWGRGSETPMFEFGVRMREVPAEMVRETMPQVKATA